MEKEKEEGKREREKEEILCGGVFNRSPEPSITVVMMEITIQAKNSPRGQYHLPKQKQSKTKAKN